MAPGITYEKQMLNTIKEHLRIRRHGDAIRLVWENKSEVTEGKVWTTLISEVSITDIPSQRKGSVYHAKN